MAVAREPVEDAVRGLRHPLVRGRLELRELHEPPVGAVPFLVGVDGGVVQAVQECSDAWPVHHRLVVLLAEQVAAGEPPDGRLVGAEQPLHGRGGHVLIILVDAFGTFEREGWSEGRAAPYHHGLGAITSRPVEALLDAARVGAGSSVLDVATGPGYAAGRAAARGATVVGVDFSDEMLSLAASLHPSVSFQRADAGSLPFSDGVLRRGRGELPHAPRRRPARRHRRARAGRAAGRPARARHLGSRARDLHACALRGDRRVGRHAAARAPARPAVLPVRRLRRVHGVAARRRPY